MSWMEIFYGEVWKTLFMLSHPFWMASHYVGDGIWRMIRP